MKKYLIAFLISFCCGNVCCTNAQLGSKNLVSNDSMNNVNIMNLRKTNYHAAIIAIEKKVIDLTSADDLFDVEEFKEIYEHSSFYLSDAVRFIDNDTTTSQQKIISVYSMQKLMLKDYIKFAVSCKEIFDKKRIAEIVLLRAISPNFGSHKPIVENFENKDVRQFLRTVEESENASRQLKETARNILSGEYRDNIKHRR